MRKCPRNIDKPLLLFGLEPEDVGILALAGGLLIMFFDTFYAGLVFFGGWMFLRLIKQGKPQGYITHLFYKRGFRIKGLIDPPKITSRYSVFRKEEENAITEFYNTGVVIDSFNLYFLLLAGLDCFPKAA